MSRHLVTQGTEVIGLSRSVNGLEITNETSVQTHLTAILDPVDLIIVATGALEIAGDTPEKTLRTFDPGAAMRQFATNTIGPMLVLKHCLHLVRKDSATVFAALSARVGSIGDNRLGGWYSYRTAKAGLNQMLHTAAIELARTHKHLACVSVHPGTVETPFTQKYLGRHPAVPADIAAGRLLDVLQCLHPQDTGRFLDYTGQDIPW